MTDIVLPHIEAYVEAHSMPESAVCRALREETYRTMESPRMIVGPDERTAVIQELNRLVADDPRVTAVMVTIRDGVLVVRKKGVGSR